MSLRPARHPSHSCARLLLAGSLLLGSAAVMAQKLSVTPAPGLWENTQTMKLGGIEMGALMRQAHAEAMKQLPPEHRAMAEQAMAAMGGGPSRECLTPEQARAASDPAALLRQINEDQDGNCRFDLVSTSGNTLNLRGQCRAEDGWNGAVQGAMTMHDARRWSSRFTGSGRWQGDLPPGVPTRGGAVEMLMEGSGRWLAAACGDVKPVR